MNVHGLIPPHGGQLASLIAAEAHATKRRNA